MSKLEAKNVVAANPATVHRILLAARRTLQPCSLAQRHRFCGSLWQLSRKCIDPFCHHIVFASRANNVSKLSTSDRYLRGGVQLSPTSLSWSRTVMTSGYSRPTITLTPWSPSVRLRHERRTPNRMSSSQRFARWTPTFGLIIAALICPALSVVAVWYASSDSDVAVASSRSNLQVAPRSDAHLSPEINTRAASTTRPIQRPAAMPLHESRVAGRPVPANTPSPPAPAEALLDLALPGIPPSVELAELIAAGLVEPGTVEFDFDPDHPVAGQIVDSLDNDTDGPLAQMPPPTRVEPPHHSPPAPTPKLEPAGLPRPPVIPPSVRLAELIEQGTVIPGQDAFDVAAPEASE